ncbi:MAG: hypothetical protein IJX17_00850 [Clostridia bacterium]|nr:hypothetical protein [Clostridia bacterium]
MENNTTNELLDKTYENVRMASYAIDCIMEKIENEKFANLLRKQNEFYLETVTYIENLAEKLGHKLKDINLMQKSMSFVSIKMKTIMNNDSPKLAEMLIQGTTMGITDTIKAKNEFPTKNKD